MKPILTLFFFLFLSLFPVPIQSQTKVDSLERYWKPNMGKVRIVSYNIFNGFDWGKDNERQKRFIDWIIDKDPEVLALQELCGFTEATLLKVAEKWGHQYAAIVKEEGYPVGITSKKPISVKAKLVEGYGHGLLHVETFGFDFLVTHLNPSDTRKRHDEAGQILDYIRKNNLDNFLLMGDMNAHSPMDADYMEAHATSLLMKYGGKSSTNLMDGSFDYSIISGFLAYPMFDVCRKYVPADKRTTFPTPILMNVSSHKAVRSKVGERIDFIFVPSKVFSKVVDAFIFNEGNTDYLSDHYPVAVDLFSEK